MFSRLTYFPVSDVFSFTASVSVEFQFRRFRAFYGERNNVALRRIDFSLHWPFSAMAT